MVLEKLGPILTGVGTVATALATLGIFSVEKARKEYEAKLSNDRLQWDKKKDRLDRLQYSIIKMESSKKELKDILYGSKHPQISACMAMFLSRFEEHDDPNVREKKARIWYEKEYLVTHKKDLSLEDQDANRVLEINKCRSLARDNFIQIAGLMEEYHVSYVKAKDFGFKEDVDLLKSGDANEIWTRYNRFWNTVQYFDKVMGYLKGDGAIYKKEDFKNGLTKSVPESLKSRLKF